MRTDIMKVVQKAEDVSMVEEEDLEEWMIVTLLMMKREVKIHKPKESGEDDQLLPIPRQYFQLGQGSQTPLSFDLSARLYLLLWSYYTLLITCLQKKKSIFSKFIDFIHWYARIPPLVNLLLPLQVLNQQDESLSIWRESFFLNQECLN